MKFDFDSDAALAYCAGAVEARMSEVASASFPPSSASRGRRVSAWAGRHFKWLMVAPAALLILALSIYPMLFSLWVAFVNYDFQIPGHDFVGLQNFAQIIDDPLAWSSLGLTLVLSVTVVVIEFVLGLALALAMVRTFRGRGIIMSILIIPLFISPVIVGQSWALFLQRPFGPADYLLSLALGRTVAISWVGEAPWVYIAILVADVWQWRDRNRRRNRQWHASSRSRRRHGVLGPCALSAYDRVRQYFAEPARPPHAETRDR
jgi:multiple sugar transport system permease protein